MEGPRRRVVITGATGFIGRPLVTALKQQFDVIGISRTPTNSGDIACDLARSMLGPEALAGVACVYHLAASAHTAPPTTPAERQAVFDLNTGATIRLAQQAAQAGVERFVFLSTSKVLGDQSTTPLAEDAAIQPAGAYAESKAAAEAQLHALAQEVGMHIAIVRPPLVYGPGVRANFAALLKLAASRWPLPLGQARGLRSFVCVANLVAFLQLVGMRGEGVFHVTDPSSVPVAQLIREIRSLLCQPNRLIGVPEGMVRSVARLVGRSESVARLYDAMQLSDAHARSALKWTPPVTRSRALEETVNWYLTSR